VTGKSLKRWDVETLNGKMLRAEKHRSLNKEKFGRRLFYWETIGFFCTFGVALLAAGCVSKSKAKAEARAAFMAGQQQAMMQMAQPHPAVVTFIGPVRNPTVPWSQGLTLAKAIVDAGYQAPADPQHIMIVRNGQAIPVDPKQLLQGEDIPLVAGDLVQIGQ
jgi:hypothetical protein